MKRLFVLMLIGVSFWLWGCYSNGPTASNDPGSGSEIVGKVEYGDTSDTAGMSKTARAEAALGIPVIGALIYIYPEDFAIDPGKPINDYAPSARTGSDGRFRIDNVPVGTWVLEATDGTGKTVCRRITVPGDGRQIDVGTLILAAPASLRIHLNTTSAPQDLSFNVFVLGTRAYAGGSDGTLSLDVGSIPTGEPLSVRVQIEKPLRWSTTIDSVRFQPGLIEKTIDLPF